MLRKIFALAVVALVAFPVMAGPVGNAARSGDVAKVEELIGSGADIDEADAMASPLHFAAMGGHVAVVDLLARNGAVLEAKSDMLGTPLHAAARMGHADAVRALLSAGADPNSRDRNAFTPLMIASVENRPEVVAALIAAGADLDAVGLAPGGGQLGKGPTIALQLARRYGHDDIVGILSDAGAGAVPPVVPDDLLEKGRAEEGRELAYMYCAECHRLEEGDPPRTENLGAGPDLVGVMGREVAQFPGFAYSTALYDHGGVWTPERFYAFALTPALTVPGTKMNWAPDRTPEMIADITAYFASVAE